MGKSAVDKDALVPSKGLTFLTGLLQGLKGAVDTRKAKEIEQQKQQFQMQKFLVPLLFKQRQFEQTETRERFEFEQTQSLALQESEASLSKINAQIEQWKSSNLLAQKQFGLEEQKFEAQKANTIFDQLQAQIASLQATVAEQNRNIRHTETLESAEGIAARREGGLDKRAEEARLATIEAELLSNFRKNEGVLRGYQEELADPTSEFRGDSKLARSAVHLARRMLVDWAQLRDMAAERGDPAPQIPAELELYKETNWFKSIFGGEEFGVEPVIKPKSEATLPRPAAAVLAVPARKADITKTAKAFREEYKGRDIPDIAIQALRGKFTEEEVQKIIGKK